MSKYYNPAVETAPEYEMRSWQSYNLSKTIRRVYDRVPFYRDRMKAAGITPKDIRSIEDISKLPFTTKIDLRDTYPYGLFACDMSEVVRLHASSGTTGKQTVVGYTKKDVELWSECVARSLVAFGGTKDDLIHVAYGYGLFTGGLGMHYGAELLGATVLPASAGKAVPTARQIDMIRDFGSTILCCTPSYALYIGDVITELGIDPKDLKLKVGVFGAEPWTENMRREIETRLGIRAYDIYGLSEISGPGVSFGCSTQNGMHINEDHFYPEIIDPETGKILPEGEMGELVFTSITKEAFPLIRYRTRDITSLTRQPCSCGRTLVKMSKPQGRSDDMLIIRGVNVFPSQIESVLLSFNNEDMVPHYMIEVDRINNLDTLEVLVEMSSAELADEVKKLEAYENKLKSAIENTLGVNAKVRLVEPHSIERSEGKAKRVIDKRNLN